MSTILDAALDYIARDFSVVPVHFRNKKPINDEGWQHLRINAAEAHNYFNGVPQNIGIILGRASAGLTDLDLDCPEAIAAAPYLLPSTATFAVTCLGYAYFEGNTLMSGWIEPKLIDEFISKIDWRNTSVLMHHAHFDGIILSYHYVIHPQFFMDTLSMAQAIFPGEPASLEALASKFGLRPKSVPYAKMNGVHPSVMEPALSEEIGQGAAYDCEITLSLFETLRQNFPPDELSVIDMTVKMFTNPRLVGRADELNAFAEAAKLRVEGMLEGLNVTAKQLGSNPKFAALLEVAGVTVEMKPGKRGPIPAIAKSDDFMTRLLGQQ